MYEYEVLHIFVPCLRKEGREGGSKDSSGGRREEREREKKRKSWGEP